VLIRFCGQRSKVKVIALNDPKTLWTPYLKNQRREFYGILVSDVYGFADELIKFWGQRPQSKHPMTRKPCERHIWKSEGNFTQSWSRMYFDSQVCWLAQRSKVVVTAGRGITVEFHLISSATPRAPWTELNLNRPHAWKWVRLKMHARNMGIPSPEKSGVQSPLLSTSSQLYGKFNGL